MLIIQYKPPKIKSHDINLMIFYKKQYINNSLNNI